MLVFLKKFPFKNTRQLFRQRLSESQIFSWNFFFPKTKQLNVSDNGRYLQHFAQTEYEFLNAYLKANAYI